MKAKDWSGFSVVISAAGRVTLRRPAGRSIAWFGCADVGSTETAQKAVKTYHGSVLVDKRKEGAR